MKTTQVLGEDLKVGQVVFIQGFQFQINEVREEKINPSDALTFDRHFVTCTWVGEGPKPPAFALGDRGMSSGLRKGLLWTVRA